MINNNQANAFHKDLETQSQVKQKLEPNQTV